MVLTTKNGTVPVGGKQISDTEIWIQFHTTKYYQTNAANGTIEDSISSNWGNVKFPFVRAKKKGPYCF